MITHVGKFSFRVPGVPGEEGAHVDAGKKLEKAFEYQQCETQTEAEDVLTARKMTVLELTNEYLKATARANSYQAALFPYRPNTKTQDEMAESMVRDLIRMGFTEEKARAKVAVTLAELNAE